MTVIDVIFGVFIKILWIKTFTMVLLINIQLCGYGHKICGLAMI